ncbi:MAG: hypothetical protein JW866_03550 [Ignavibacteriales bacterium]|nr:hypothetical protein [Ignavibacteriales bacterium]
MKISLKILFILLFILLHSVIFSQDTTNQNNQGNNFIDLDGDGYNDNAPDHDGDGIPNGLDPDYNPQKHQWGKKKFVDLDGDGIDDNILNEDRKQKGKINSDNQENKGKLQKGKWYFDSSKFRKSYSEEQTKGKGNIN